MFDFLSQVTLEETTPDKAPRKGGPRKERNPEGLKIRVFYDGSIFPSKELVDKFNLEYGNKPKEVEGQKTPDITGFGFDIIDSRLYPAFKLPAGAKVILISPVLKSAPKVDLFGTTNFNEDGTPKTSVLTQGNKTFGTEDLIPMLEEVYGIELKKLTTTVTEEGSVEEYNDGPEFIDLEFLPNPASDQPWESKVSFIPKKVNRGKDKGAVTTTRRENVALYVLAPVAPVKVETPKVSTESEAKLTVDESVIKA